MQKILSFNTIFQGVNIIISENSGVIFDRIYDSKKQSEILISSIENALLETNLKYENIDCFSSILGPGNFTGIKTGLAVLKMLKISTKKKIITNNLFEIISFNQNSDINIININDIKYYIENKINKEYSVIKHDEIFDFITNNSLNKFKILTNDKNIFNFLNEKCILSEFDNNKLNDLITFKYKNNIFDDKIEPLYIEQVNITKRKS